jgi:hypothetical protein
MCAVKRVMEVSLAKTLACKHKSTVNKIFKGYKVTVETRDGVYGVLQVKVECEGKRALVAQFGGIRMGFDKDADIDDDPKQVFHTRSQLIDRLMCNTCELCGVEEVAVEVHYVCKLKGLSKSGRCHRSEWMKRMIAMRCKTLAVCAGCHYKIHSGVYDRVCVC